MAKEGTKVAAKKLRVEIIQEPHPEPPRCETNLGTMVTFHRNYTIGDEQPDCSPDEWLFSLLPDDEQEKIEEWEEQYYEDHSPAIGEAHECWDGFYRELHRLKGDKVTEVLERLYYMAPIFAYIHSGITISLGSFSCPWDSGQLGWIYCSKEKAENEGLTEEQVQGNFKAEIGVYDQYLQGYVWGFRVYEVETCNLGHEHEGEEIDSCWGFYGEDLEETGIRDHVTDDISDEELEQAWEDRKLGY